MHLWTREEMTRTVDLLTGENNCTEAVLAYEGWPPGLGVVGMAMLLAAIGLPWPLVATLPLGAGLGLVALVVFARPMIVARAGDEIVLARIRLTVGKSGTVVARARCDGTIPVAWPGGAGVFAKTTARFRVAGHSLSSSAQRDRVAYVLGCDVG